MTGLRTGKQIVKPRLCASAFCFAAGAGVGEEQGLAGFMEQLYVALSFSASHAKITREDL
ncbi:MAG: hypothetical protein ACE5I2_09420 [Anaerolineae bacterium]